MGGSAKATAKKSITGGRSVKEAATAAATFEWSAGVKTGGKDREDASFIKHCPCDECGSSDARAVYEKTDGSQYEYCFRCQKRYGNGEPVAVSPAARDLLTLEYAALPLRKLREDTCRKYSYGRARHRGKPVQVATYYDATGRAKCQKLRGKDKSFSILGDAKGMGLWGQHLFRDNGKRVIITEGEIDALSCAQVLGLKWPVVSLPNGAASARKSLAAAMNWLQGYAEIVLCFDQDEAGQKAVEECAALFKPGTLKVAKLPRKDANEMLVAGENEQLVRALWEASTWRPDGLLSGETLWQEVMREEACSSIDYPWEGLNDKLLGLRTGELVTITAGTGIGKSAVVREITHYLLSKGQSVGYLGLEEPVKRTVLGVLGIEIGKPLAHGLMGTTEEELRAAFDKVMGNAVFLDHWGSLGSGLLMGQIRYMAAGMDCRWIVLDHVSIVVSSQEEVSGSMGERQVLDKVMTELRLLCHELDIGMLVVSHLKRPEGKGHEEGAVTSLAQLRGSASIGQLSDAVIGLERDQQAETDEARNTTTVRVLKNRYTGDTGVACYLQYSSETGRLQASSADTFVSATEEVPFD